MLFRSKIHFPIKSEQLKQSQSAETKEKLNKSNILSRKPVSLSKSMQNLSLSHPKSVALQANDSSTTYMQHSSLNYLNLKTRDEKLNNSIKTSSNLDQEIRKGFSSIQFLIV